VDPAFQATGLDPDLESALLILSDPILGIRVKTRKSKLKTYQNCFVARKAVTCLIKNHNAKGRSDATQKLQSLYRGGYIVPVASSDPDFKDKQRLFRYTLKARRLFGDKGFPERALLCEEECEKGSAIFRRVGSVGGSPIKKRDRKMSKLRESLSLVGERNQNSPSQMTLSRTPLSSPLLPTMQSPYLSPRQNELLPIKEVLVEQNRAIQRWMLQFYTEERKQSAPTTQTAVAFPIADVVWQEIHIESTILCCPEMGKLFLAEVPSVMPTQQPKMPTSLVALQAAFQVHVSLQCYRFPHRCEHYGASSPAPSSNKGIVKTLYSALRSQEGRSAKAAAGRQHGSKCHLLANIDQHAALHCRIIDEIEHFLGVDFHIHAGAIRAVVANDVVALNFFGDLLNLALPVLAPPEAELSSQSGTALAVFAEWCSQRVDAVKARCALSSTDARLFEGWALAHRHIEKLLKVYGKSWDNGPANTRTILKVLDSADIPPEILGSALNIPPSSKASGVSYSALESFILTSAEPNDLLTQLRDALNCHVNRIMKSSISKSGLYQEFVSWAAQLNDDLLREVPPEALPVVAGKTLLELSLLLGRFHAAAQLVELGSPFESQLTVTDVPKIAQAAMSLGFLQTWRRLRAQYGADLTNVRRVDLTGLHLNAVPADLAEISPSLESIDLSFNRLNILPSFLASCEDIRVACNPLVCLPRHLHIHPTNIPAYLAAVKRTEESWSTVKVSVLCLTPVTAAVRSVLHRTLGLRSHMMTAPPTPLPPRAQSDTFSELTTWSFTLRHGELSVNVNVWLLQEGPWMHSTDLLPVASRLFLTLSSLHLIVFDPSHPDMNIDLLTNAVWNIKQMELFYNSFAKISFLEVKSADAASLAPLVSTRFPQIPLSSVVSKDTALDMGKFTILAPNTAGPEADQLDFQARLGDCLCSSLPRTLLEAWAHAIHFLMAAEVDYVQRAGLHKWFSLCGVKPDDFNQLEEFLIRHGVIYGWKSGDSLGESVLLNPKCVQNVLHQFRACKPNLVVSSMVDIFERSSGPAQLLPCGIRALELPALRTNIIPAYVLQALVAHGVVLEVSVNTFMSALLVPALLPRTMPDISSLWNVRNALEHIRIYRMPFLSPSLFQVFLMKMLKGHQLPLLAVWQSGLLVGRPSEAVLVTANYKKREITVKEKLSQTTKSKHFLLLLNVLESVLKSEAKQMAVDRIVPCAHCLRRGGTAQPWEFKYDTLVALSAQGKPFAYCEDMVMPSRCVQISRLAPDVALSYFPQIKPEDIEEGEVVGKGAFGIVKKCKWNGMHVAVKEQANATSGDVMAAFKEILKEATIMSNLKSPFLVCMYGVAPPLRLVMEFVPCGDLFHLLHGKQAQPLDVCQQARLVLDIAKGMHYLQSILPPILHRDLRSPNIFIQSLDVNAEVCAKVADFGLSLQTFGEVQEKLLCWQWLAPEVLKGESYDTQSDVYSFGMVMYEVLARRIPFDEFYEHPRFMREITLPDGSQTSVLKEQNLKAAILSEGLLPTLPLTPLGPLAELMSMCWLPSPDARPTFNGAVNVSQDVFSRCLRGGFDTLARVNLRSLLSEETVVVSQERDMYNDVLSDPIETSDGDVHVAEPSAPPTSQVTTSEFSDATLLLDMNECTFTKFSMSCMTVRQQEGQVWVGSLNGMVVVYSLQTNSVMVILRFSDSRVVEMVPYLATVVCVLETGHAHFIHAFTFQETHSVCLTTDTVSAVHLASASFNDLWCSCPNVMHAGVWRLSQGAVGAPTFIRVLMDDTGLRVESGKKRFGKPPSGRTPIIVDAITSRQAVVILACTGVVVTLNSDLQAVEVFTVERECGRITSMHPCGGKTLLGTYQGVVQLDGDRLFSLRTRIVDIQNFSGGEFLCLGYDGSLVWTSKLHQPVKEFKLPCGNSTLVKLGMFNAKVLYGLRDGKLYSMALKSLPQGLSFNTAFTLEDVQSNPMIEKAWAFLEMIVVKKCKGSSLDPFFRKFPSHQALRDAMESLFKPRVQALPLLLQLLCFHFESLHVETGLNLLQDDLRELMDDCEVCEVSTGSDFSGALIQPQSATLLRVVEDLVHFFVERLKGTSLS